MLEVVSMIFIVILTHLFDCYAFTKIINKKYKKTVWFYLLVIVLSIIDYYIGSTSGGMVKNILANIISIFLFKIMSKEPIVKLLMSMIIIYLGYVVSELVVYGFSLLLHINMELLTKNIFGNVIGNLIIIGIYIFILKIKWLINKTEKIIKWCGNNSTLDLILNSVLIMITIYIILYLLAYNKNYASFEFLMLCILIGIIVFVIGYYNQKSNNNQLIVKYDELLDYVKDYEKEVVEKGKAIHEHKNQLAVIDGLIPKNNKKLKKYVGEKLDNISKLDDNIWLEKLTNLPTGGIKGLVYLKIKKMINNGITIFIEIDNDLKNKSKWKSVNNNLEDYTKILGVYLDNAIEASIDSKDKQIIIEFIDNKDNIEFILSNTYKGKINFSEIDNEKFSTKGNGRGYGLSLVKDIIDKNTYINQSREINGKFYVQKLYIKK